MLDVGCWVFGVPRSTFEVRSWPPVSGTPLICVIFTHSRYWLEDRQRYAGDTLAVRHPARGSKFKVQGSRFKVPRSMLDVRCWVLDVRKMLWPNTLRIL